MTKSTLTLHKPPKVNAAGTWDEAYRSYLGRSGRYAVAMNFNTATRGAAMYG